MKKASPDAKGKEETAAAATKSDKKQDDKPKEAVPQYCFRCGSEGHQVRGCDKVGDLKCENHPNHTSHLTEACNITRIKKGLPLHPFMAAKRTASHSGAQATLERIARSRGPWTIHLQSFRMGGPPHQSTQAAQSQSRI